MLETAAVTVFDRGELCSGPGVSCVTSRYRPKRTIDEVQPAMHERLRSCTQRIGLTPDGRPGSGPAWKRCPGGSSERRPRKRSRKPQASQRLNTACATV